ncbi:hypothetical protein E2F47_13770, partial [Mycobacterium eburneum]
PPQPPGYPPQPPWYPPQTPWYPPQRPEYPPQPPGYPSQPPGYPPQPPAYGPPTSYGAPPGYPQPGYGPPPGRRFDAGEAFNWAWNKFSKNAAALIVPFLAYGALLAVPTMIAVGVMAGGSDGSGPGAAAVVIAMLCYLIVIVVAMLTQAAYLSGCLEIADGKPVTIGSFFSLRNVGQVLVALLLVGGLVFVGSLLCVIPGLIVAFLAQFTIPFVIDRSLPPMDALKASYTTVKNNIGDTFLSYLVQMAVIFVGEMLCGVGLIVAMPVAILVQVYTYRRLSGGRVAPAQP